MITMLVSLYTKVARLAHMMAVRWLCVNGYQWWWWWWWFNSELPNKGHTLEKLLWKNSAKVKSFNDLIVPTRNCYQIILQLKSKQKFYGAILYRLVEWNSFAIATYSNDAVKVNWKFIWYVCIELKFIIGYGSHDSAYRHYNSKTLIIAFINDTFEQLNSRTVEWFLSRFGSGIGCRKITNRLNIYLHLHASLVQCSRMLLINNTATNTFSIFL